jgi:2-dehydro-3-deoxyphosphooctonate aldolase (KDO 8-P synthase)
MHTTQVGNVSIDDAKLTVIAGPCVAESLDLCLEVGEQVRDRCAKLGLNYIFKASFDKANRSSIHSSRGPGLERGLAILAEVKKRLGVPMTTDVHESQQAGPIAQAGVDLLQVPAFLCRQTDLLVACAATGRPVNVKKGQFLSPAEMSNVVTKLREADAKGIMLTERGTFFGYHRLVNDFVGVADMMELGFPVCFDVTHSTQQPGGLTSATGGRPDRAPLLAKLAVTAGVQALFIETHPQPSKAMSDAAVMLPVERTLELLGELAEMRG